LIAELELVKGGCKVAERLSEHVRDVAGGWKRMSEETEETTFIPCEMIPVMHILSVSSAAHCLGPSVAVETVALKAAWQPRSGTEMALAADTTRARARKSCTAFISMVV
jgi:hypothetical protein